MDEEIVAETPDETPDTADLTARLAAAETENRLYRMAPGLGVSAAAVPYLARLCGVSPGADDDALRRSLEDVLTALPGLRERPVPDAAGLRMGAGVAPRRDDESELLRAAFGIR